ncbi:unnamed protein product [Protopolystoma xenopodis]|uniref:Uncharacterized protein n=1 Tax=Protopolystoma xenopodis TaxID=117903 RepID=A0A3S5CGX9_9PLAT|nr:unnamed protein product [Protopolystoma xenopodis]
MLTAAEDAHEKFTSVRKRLDQLGYRQPLGIDSLPLVERLLADLIWTTENLRKVKLELEKRIEIRNCVEDYVAPYKSDNAKLVKENNELHTRLKADLRRIDNDKQDLTFFNTQCLGKLKSYEIEAQEMAKMIMAFQGKNFNAVVNVSGKQKPSLRRQRMDIDTLLPLREESGKYCCKVAKFWADTEKDFEPKSIDLVASTTRQCEVLEQQISFLESQLELDRRKVDNFRQQLTLRDAEIDRLRAVCEGGRPLEALIKDTAHVHADRLIRQLQLQVEILQSRNDELEARVFRLVKDHVEPGFETMGKENSNSIPGHINEIPVSTKGKKQHLSKESPIHSDSTEINNSTRQIQPPSQNRGDNKDLKFDSRSPNSNLQSGENELSEVRYEVGPDDIRELIQHFDKNRLQLSKRIDELLQRGNLCPCHLRAT